MSLPFHIQRIIRKLKKKMKIHTDRSTITSCTRTCFVVNDRTLDTKTFSIVFRPLALFLSAPTPAPPSFLSLQLSSSTIYPCCAYSFDDALFITIASFVFRHILPQSVFGYCSKCVICMCTMRKSAVQRVLDSFLISPSIQFLS